MAGKKGLGTGLNALFGEAERDESQEIQMLPISRVEPREEQPRTNFDEASLQELAESIREYGLIPPPELRLLPDNCRRAPLARRADSGPARGACPRHRGR